MRAKAASAWQLPEPGQERFSCFLSVTGCALLSLPPLCTWRGHSGAHARSSAQGTFHLLQRWSEGWKFLLEQVAGPKVTAKNRAQRDEPSGRGAGTQQPVGTICCRAGLCRGAAMGQPRGWAETRTGSHGAHSSAVIWGRASPSLSCCICCCIPLAPPPQMPGPRLHAMLASSGIACSSVLTPRYLVLADDPGRRQRRGEDVSAGPV